MVLLILLLLLLVINIISYDAIMGFTLFELARWYVYTPILRFCRYSTNCIINKPFIIT